MKAKINQTKDMMEEAVTKELMEKTVSSKIIDMYGKKGNDCPPDQPAPCLSILMFPTNEFGLQEPGNDTEIIRRWLKGIVFHCIQTLKDL